MGCTVWVYFWKVGIGQPNYAQIFRMFWQDVLIYAFFYHYYLLVYVLRYVVYNFSIFLVFWYVIILSGGFLKILVQ